MIASILSFVFFIVLACTVYVQRRAYNKAMRVHKLVEQFAVENAPAIKTAYIASHGRASTELEEAFPGQDTPPHGKTSVG